MDNMLLDIDNLLKTHFSTSYALIKVSVIEKENKKILVFEVKDSSKPVYFSINDKKEFYIRRSASSIALTIEEAVSYINDHF
jgi:predicted HTH transcriptional regulator